jgi:hypothetical protein
MSAINTTQQKTFFKVKEGSNYIVSLINRKKYVIEYDQFRKLAGVLNSEDTVFVTINGSIVNKNRIEDIEPTQEQTEDQIKAKEQSLKEKEKKSKESKEEANRFSWFRKEWLDSKYGVDNWNMFKEGVTDMKAISEDYKEKKKNT